MLSLSLFSVFCARSRGAGVCGGVDGGLCQPLTLAASGTDDTGH